MDDALPITGTVKATLENIKTGEKQVFEYKNLVVFTGRLAVAKRLSGDLTKTGEITVGAVGTGSQSVLALDSQLQQEIFRKALTTRGLESGVSIAKFTLTLEPAEANATLRELGLYGEGASATFPPGIVGTLFNRVVINITKTNEQKLTFESTITV